MSRPILQPRSRSCRTRHDGNNVWNPSLSACRATPPRWPGRPQIEPCAVPLIIQSQRDVCPHGFLPAPPRSVGYARRRSPCALAAMAYAHAAGHVRCAVPSPKTLQDTWRPGVDFPEDSGLCRNAVCKTIRAAIGVIMGYWSNMVTLKASILGCARRTFSVPPAPALFPHALREGNADPVQATAPPARVGQEASGAVAWARLACMPRASSLAETLAGGGPSPYRGEYYGGIHSQPQGVGA
jgi:hypothetical protein